MKLLLGFTAPTALCAIAALTPVAAQDIGPGDPPFSSHGPANEFARACQNAAELTGFALSVGTCLALERENALNELATICAYLSQNDYLPIVSDDGTESITTVAECIQALEDF